MRIFFDAFWRAVGYCLLPRVILLSLLPLLFGLLLALGAGWFYWEGAVAAVREGLSQWQLVDAALLWVENLIGTSFRSVLAPLLVVLLAVPLIVVLALLLVALLTTPAVVSLVAQRRFPQLQRRRGAGTLTSALWSIGWSLVALLLLAASVPLWVVPPVALVLPPLVWGWLTYQVMSFDVLAEHASADERRQLMAQHRTPLLVIGIVCGYLGAAPTLIWAAGALTLVFAPLLIGISVWLYTLVFAFSSLWFAHFALAALQQLRSQTAAQAARKADGADGADGADAARAAPAAASRRPVASGEVIDADPPLRELPALPATQPGHTPGDDRRPLLPPAA